MNENVVGVLDVPCAVKVPASRWPLLSYQPAGSTTPSKCCAPVVASVVLHTAYASSVVARAPLMPYLPGSDGAFSVTS
ncbi:hypothetical protein ISO18_35195, partial [Burkholderia pseudomultivorans]|nr:hypothetical protein [Burkholderia pseudomultivorans]